MLYIHHPILRHIAKKRAKAYLDMDAYERFLYDQFTYRQKDNLPF